MKNIMKIIVGLLTSVSLITSSNAGELTVTGSAKASYNMISGWSADGGQGKGLGIANEIDFGATGELDSGITWKYQVQFDPGATSTAGGGGIDDTRLEVTIPNIATVAMYVSEGGLDTDNAASQSVYGRPTDIGLSSGIADGPGIGSFNNIQIHSPKGLLPLDAVFKAAYAPGQSGSISSKDAAGAVNNLYGDAAEQYQIKLTPEAGLNVGADYYKESGAGDATNIVVQAFEAGSIFATYDYGAASFGVSATKRTPLILSTSATATTIGNASTAGGNADSVRIYESEKASVAYNINDSLSVSYEIEKSSRELITQTTESDIKAEAVQAAYTMGGMTLALSHGKMGNRNYVEDRDSTQTLFGVSMAF